MLKSKTSVLAFFCFGLLALPATPATYDYYLQVPAAPEGELSAWTASWTSNTLNPPICPATPPNPVVSAFLDGRAHPQRRLHRYSLGLHPLHRPELIHRECKLGYQ